MDGTGEAVECASEELSDTMYDPFGVSDLSIKRKYIASYIQPANYSLYAVF